MPQIEYTAIQSPCAWTAAESLVGEYYRQFFTQQTKGASLWESYKMDPRTALVIATINGEPLGVAVGGRCRSTSHLSLLHAVVVHPDCRRRGIGTRLVRRFLAHTGLPQVGVLLFKEPGDEPFEVAQFFQSLGGRLKKRYAILWYFSIPN